MDKSQALQLLGGTTSAVAEAVGVTPSAVSQWPDVLPPRVADRVMAALARKHLPAELMERLGQAQVPAGDAKAGHDV